MKSHTVSLLRSAFYGSSFVLFVSGTACFGESPNPLKATIPSGINLPLSDSAYVFEELELGDNCKIVFTGGQKKVELIVQKLILHGQSTIDLTPPVSSPGKPAKAPARTQAGNNPAPQNGQTGITGETGAPGANGIELKMNVVNFDANDGSMWIKTDGIAGGPGGDGGDGGKGSSGPQTGFSNPDGGNGGPGGTGGMGGKGGGTSAVTLTVGGITVKPSKTNGVAPSTRPSVPPKTIVIAGAPGDGGPGGAGGAGGPGGEGHKGSGPFTTDSNSGGPGPVGAPGSKGPVGDFAQ